MWSLHVSSCLRVLSSVFLQVPDLWLFPRIVVYRSVALTVLRSGVLRPTLAGTDVSLSSCRLLSASWELGSERTDKHLGASVSNCCCCSCPSRLRNSNAAALIGSSLNNTTFSQNNLSCSLRGERISLTIAPDYRRAAGQTTNELICRLTRSPIILSEPQFSPTSQFEQC